MTFADDTKRRMELRRKIGNGAVQSIRDRDEKRMRLQSACNHILGRVRRMRHSVGKLM